MAQELTIRINADGSGAVVGIKNVAAGLQTLQTNVANIDRSAESATASLARMGHAAAAALSVREVVQAADAWASMNAQLKIATGSAAAGAEAYSQVVRTALQTGQAVGEISNVYKRFADNATTLGINQQQVAAATTTVAQAIALSGGSAASAQAALTQFGQALASGTLRGEELNSVLEQAPRLAKTLADGMGVPIGKLRELAEQGKITSEEIVKALSGQAAKVADEFGQLPVTIGRAMTNLNTAFIDTVGSFEKSTGVFNAAAQGLDGIAKQMDVVAAAGGAMTAVMAGRVAASLAASVQATITSTQAQQVALVAAESLAAGELRRASANEVAAASALGKARAEVAATQMAIAVDRERLTSTALIIRAEMELEKVRLAAQINDVGRAARVQAMANLSKELAAIETAAAGVAARLTAVREAQTVATVAAAEATAALGMAQARASAATAATAAGAGLATRALGVLGGPVGVITTALTLGGTAWMLWGNKAEDATKEAARSAAQNLDSIINKITEMNGRLADTSRKAFDATLAAGASDLKTVRAEIGQLQTQLDSLDAAGGRGRFSDAGKTLQTELNGWAAREIALQQELGEARAKSAEVGTAALIKFIDTNAVGADKIRITQSKLLQEFAQGIAQTGGVFDANNKMHAAALTALNAGLADAAKGAKKAGTETKDYNLHLDQMALVHKQVNEELATRAKQEAEYTKALYAADDALVSKAEALEYEVQYYGMTESAINAVIVARLEEARAIAAENGAYPEHLAFLDREIEARQRIANASGQKEALDANEKAAKEAAKDWEKASDDTSRALTDSIMRGFESSKPLAESFFDSLENYAKTTVLKFGVNFVTNGAQNLIGSLGNAAINGVLGTGGSNGGAGTNYLGMANNASTLNTAYGLYSQGWGATAGNMISGAGNLLGSSGIAAYGAGYSAGLSGVSEAIAAYNTAAANAVAAGEASQALIYSNTASSLAAGGSATGAGAGSGGASSSGMGASAVGWIAAIVMGMYMSGEAWQNGIRWENYAKDPDAKKYDAEVGIRALHDEPARAIFGDSFVESKLYAVLSGSSLSAQIHGAIKKAVWGGEWEAKGKPLLRGTFSESEQGFTGQEGQKYEKDGGWFKSDSKKTKWKSAREGVDDTLDSVYRTVRNSMVMAGETFGDTSLSGKLKGFSYSTYQKNSSNMGATVNQVSDELAQAMGAILFPSIDLLRQNTVEQADALRGDLEQAKRSGNLAVASNIEAQIKNLDSLSNETWTGAFGRILQESQAVGRVFDLMGTSLSEVFGSSNANRVLLLSDALVQMFGGIDALNTSFSAYYANFYSQEEQRAQAMEDMGKSFEALNVTMPTTREGFRAMVDGLDLATVGGQATFKAMMDLQGGFANLVPAIDSMAVASAVAAEAAKAEAEAAKAAAEAFAAMSAAMLAAIDASAARMQGQASSGMGQLAKAVDLEMQRIEVTREAAAESVASIRGVFDLLTDQVASLYESVSSTKTSGAAQGADFISQALAAAKASGYLPDQDALASAITSARGGLGANNFATQFEADRAALVMAGQLSQLKAISGEQLPVAERALKAAEDQLTALDESLAFYQAQVDALLGIEENTLTLSGSIDEMGRAIVAAISGQSSALAAAILQSLASGQIGSKDAADKFASIGVKTDQMTKIGGYDAFVSSGGAVAAGGKIASNSGWTGTIPDAKAGITKAYNTMSASVTSTSPRSAKA
jgi:tape measure domain-containing protein